MRLGVDYYPEQWDSSQLEQDLDTILELGCNVIRIGEFSWHLEAADAVKASAASLRSGPPRHGPKAWT